MKIQSILCLMMVLSGSFGNPVAGEGGDSGLGLMASLGEAFFPLMASMISDEISESKIKVEHGLAYNEDTVTNLGNVWNVQKDISCCEKCKESYKETELFELLHRTMNTKKEMRDCTCLKSKTGVNASTHIKVDHVSGQCGIWEYNGDGELGDGRIIQGGSTDFLGVVSNVDVASSCCDSCSAPWKYPDTQLFQFSSHHKQCKCHKVKIEAIPETRAHEFSVGTCQQVTDPVSEPLVSEDNKPVAEALTITTPKPEVCEGGFSCCPHPTDGDNTLGTEKFIQESQYRQDFSSCSDACKKLHPFSNGVTESNTQVYKGNKKPLCWCEFGQSKFQASSGYKTCLFKPQPIQEDDYEY